MESKYPRPKVIAVDVDDTLIVDGVPNVELIEWLREKKSEGYYLILWSMAGSKHGWLAAKDAECYSLFDIIIPKPGYIVDDDGWNWTRYTEVMDEKLNVNGSKPATGRMLRSKRDRKRSKL